MQIAFPRMTVRKWILVTAIVAVLMGCDRLLERRRYFLGQAEKWASRAEDYGENRGNLCLRVSPWSDDRVEKFCDRVWKLSLDLEQKYRFAADHPWLTVQPDPEFPDP